MTVAVADAAAIHNHRVIEQRAFTFANRFHLLQQVTQLLDLEAIDLGNLLQLDGIILMMR